MAGAGSPALRPVTIDGALAEFGFVPRRARRRCSSSAAGNALTAALGRAQLLGLGATARIWLGASSDSASCSRGTPASTAASCAQRSEPHRVSRRIYETRGDSLVGCVAAPPHPLGHARIDVGYPHRTRRDMLSHARGGQCRVKDHPLCGHQSATHGADRPAAASANRSSAVISHRRAVVLNGTVSSRKPRSAPPTGVVVRMSLRSRPHPARGPARGPRVVVTAVRSAAAGSGPAPPTAALTY